MGTVRRFLSASRVCLLFGVLVLMFTAVALSTGRADATAVRLQYCGILVDGHLRCSQMNGGTRIDCTTRAPAGTPARANSCYYNASYYSGSYNVPVCERVDHYFNGINYGAYSRRCGLNNADSADDITRWRCQRIGLRMYTANDADTRHYIGGAGDYNQSCPRSSASDAPTVEVGE